MMQNSVYVMCVSRLGTRIFWDINSESYIGLENKRSNGQGWHARLSGEKKAEYLKKLQIARQAKKDATKSSTPSSGLVQSERALFTDLTNTFAQAANDGVAKRIPLTYGSNRSGKGQSNNGGTPHTNSTEISDVTVPAQKKPRGQGWYARMSEEKRVEYLHKQQQARQRKRATANSENNDSLAALITPGIIATLYCYIPINIYNSPC